MKKNAKKNKKSKAVNPIAFKKTFWVTWILSVSSVAMVVFTQKFLPPQVPLFYGSAEGEDQLTSSLGLVLPGTLSLFVALLNTFLIFRLKDDFLQKSLVLASFVVSLLAAITTIKIIFLVGSLSL